MYNYTTLDVEFEFHPCQCMHAMSLYSSALWKENLSSEQPSLTSNHWRQKGDGVWCLKSRSWFETNTRMWRVKSSLSEKCMSKDNTDINKQYRNLHRFASNQYYHPLSQNWQHKSGQYNSMVIVNWLLTNWLTNWQTTLWVKNHYS
jgi:hypothetical protein